ncbi:serine/threonine-protein kinase [Lyngbya confervoides]|uniref:Serine/threonine-protein kinase n=1 Tax=Lyngbya confervoides BDU141951 TaxID=1574623 RepID=A0ABD4T3M8_9CYAN|nr:serine/threonine-protein kinase [Lyngbya confervoides]MCM1983174.1 serine/threonine-protein kinase [Lyngbya confervoides BDU141951]
MEKARTATGLQKVGKYEILYPLGQGSTSVVYLAKDPFINRKVALKLFNESLLRQAVSKKLAQRIFANEAALVGQFQHPHIVEVYDAILDSSQGFLVMEYVPGGTLEPFCEVSRLLPITQTVEIIFKCVRALEYAYQRGVIHRDIKPANILRTTTGDIKVSDFGSAVSDQMEETQLSGVGSPAYMAPEQLREDLLSQQSDIYSLGLVMYQLLTGHYPYSAASNVELAYQILHRDPPPPSLYRSEIPTAIDQLVMRAIAKDPAQRYCQWQDMGEALLALSSLSAPVPTITETKKFKAIQDLSFFQNFDEILIWEVLRITTWHQYPQGTRIIREGDIGDSFFIITQGEVEVLRGDRLLTQLRAGDCFGEMLYFQDTSAVRTTSVCVKSDTTVIEIQANRLNRSSDACQVEFNKAFLKILDKKIARLVALVADD